MTPLPTPELATVRAIYQSYEDSRDSFESWGLSVGELGNECDRSLWYGFRWATPMEKFDGRKIRIFARGDLEETRLIEDLERIGVEVFGQQDRIRLVHGHVRGKVDGRLLGVPDAPKTEHLFEAKSSNGANWRALAKDKLQKAQPKHYVQVQLGMHALGLTRALYLNTNKDTEEIYGERVEYDFEFCARLLARAQRIVSAHEPPSRLCTKRDDFRGKFCKHAEVCWAEQWSRVTCRSCLHVTPELQGDGHWSCARFSKPLSIDEQRSACGAHLFVPGLVPGEQVDSDPEAETVTYRLHGSGDVWVDGLDGVKDAAA